MATSFKNCFTLLLLLMVTMGVQSYAWGAAEIISSISGIPGKLAANGFLIIRKIRIADGAVLSGEILRGATSFSQNTPDEAAVVFADWHDLGSGILLGAKSKLVAPGIPPKKSLKMDLSAVSTAGGVYTPTVRKPVVSGPSSVMNIGNSSTGVSASGSGTHSSTASGLANMMMTELMKSSCWGKEGGFKIYEEQRIEEVRQEIELCKSEYFDQTTCPANHIVTPDHHLSGSVTSDGQTTQMDMNIVDSQGNVVASASGSGANYFDLVEQVGDKLGKNLCPGDIAVTEATCLNTPTQMCQGGYFITAQYKGTAHGAVGTIIRTNLGDNIGATLTCGGWTESGCSPPYNFLNYFRCCSRDNENQPESISFVAQVNLPFPITYPGGTYQAPWCPVNGPITIQLIAQFLNKGIEVDRTLVCPGQ